MTTTASPDPNPADIRSTNSTTTPTSETTTPRTTETTLDDNIRNDDGTGLDLNRGYNNSAFLSEKLLSIRYQLNFCQHPKTLSKCF